MPTDIQRALDAYRAAVMTQIRFKDNSDRAKEYAIALSRVANMALEASWARCGECGEFLGDYGCVTVGCPGQER